METRETRKLDPQTGSFASWFLCFQRPENSSRAPPSKIPARPVEYLINVRMLPNNFNGGTFLETGETRKLGPQPGPFASRLPSFQRPKKIHPSRPQKTPAQPVDRQMNVRMLHDNFNFGTFLENRLSRKTRPSKRALCFLVTEFPAPGKFIPRAPLKNPGATHRALNKWDSDSRQF